jgi:hypothetical protein
MDAHPSAVKLPAKAHGQKAFSLTWGTRRNHATNINRLEVDTANNGKQQSLALKPIL